MKNKTRNKKGFTLIELIVVIAVLGILILLAAPRFLGYTKDASIAQIKADIKTYETVASAKLVEDDEIAKDWDSVTIAEMETYRDSESLMNKKGKVDSGYIFNSEYVEIPKDLDGVKTSLKGDFIMDSGGKIYYYENGLKIEDEKSDNGNETGNKPGQEVVTNPLLDTDGDGVNDRQEIIDGTDPKDPNSFLSFDEYLLTDADFTWKEDPYVGYMAAGRTNRGYYTYTGTGKEIVKLPKVIHGQRFNTSYPFIFENGGADVKKVVLNDPTITNVSSMFYRSKITELDLSHFNTENVTRMDMMFAGSSIKKITGMNNFNTSKVTYMDSMFSNSKLETIDVSSFDTSNVESMQDMFTGIKVSSIDVSNFNTSKVWNFNNMFRGMPNITTLDLSNFDVNSGVGAMFSASWNLKTVYAGTEKDLLRLSSSDPYDRPSGLNVVLKSN